MAQPLPSSELDCVNVMLSGVGEAPVNSLETDLTADVALARRILEETSKEIQLEGWQWNTEDNYPLTPDAAGRIRLHPSIIRVHFREPSERELIVRGRLVYDRGRRSFEFARDTSLLCTVTVLLPLEDMPESARRYAAVRAMRVFQERAVGSSELSRFHQADEARARAALLAEERRLDRPNMLKGVLAPTGTWRVAAALAGRR